MIFCNFNDYYTYNREGKIEKRVHQFIEILILFKKIQDLKNTIM